jgi:cell division protein DivIC
VSLDNLYYRKDAQRRVAGRLKALLKNKRLLIGLIVGVPLLIYIVFGHRGILQRLSLESEKTELEERIRASEAEGKALEQQSKRLDNDPQTIEKVARERHNMVREGDRVYKVNPEKK